MAVIKYSAELMQQDPAVFQEFINNVSDSISELEIGGSGGEGDTYTLESTDGDGDVTLTLNANSGTDSSVVLDAGTGITINESDGTITITATGGDDDGNYVTVDTTTGEITDGTNTFQYLYRYLHVRFSASSNGASFVTDPASITGTSLYIGLANRSTNVAPTEASSYNWVEYTWSATSNVFYRKTGGNRIEFLTSTSSDITDAVGFVDGDSPLDFNTLEINTGNIVENAVTAAKISVNTVSAISADLGDITAGTLKGGTIPDADAAPSGSESGSFFDLEDGKFVVGDANEYILWDGSNVSISGVTLDANDLSNLSDLVDDLAGLDLSALDGKIASDGGVADSIANVDSQRIIGRIATGNGASQELTAADVRTIINVEDGATGDQTDAEIVSAAGSNANLKALIDFSGTPVFTDTDTTYTFSTGLTNTDGTITVSNPFTDADEIKLDGIESGADVTDTANVVASLTAGSNITIASDGTISSTDTNTTYTAGTGITLSGTQFSVTNPFTDADETKLDGIESGADVTDSANVEDALTAGTLIDISTDDTATVSVDLSELPDMTEAVVGSDDEFVILDSSVQKRKQVNEVPLSVFNNDLVNNSTITFSDGDTGTTTFNLNQSSGKTITFTGGEDIEVSELADTFTIAHANTSSVNNFNDTDGNGTPDNSNLTGVVNRLNFDSNGHVTGYSFLTENSETGDVSYVVSGSNYTLDINAGSVTADKMTTTSLNADQITAGSATIGNLVAEYAKIEAITAENIDTDVLNSNSIMTRSVQVFDDTSVSLGSVATRVTHILPLIQNDNSWFLGVNPQTNVDYDSWSDWAGNILYLNTSPDTIAALEDVVGDTLEFEISIGTATLTTNAAVTKSNGAYVLDLADSNVSEDGTPATTGSLTLSLTPLPPRIDGTTLKGTGVLLKSDGDFFAGDSAGAHLFFDRSESNIILKADIDLGNLSVNAGTKPSSDTAGFKVDVSGNATLGNEDYYITIDDTNGVSISNFYTDLTAGNASSGSLFVGPRPSDSLSPGFYNTCLGVNVMPAATTANVNVGIGTNAFEVLTTGHSNTAVGVDTFPDLTTGDFNVGLGVDSGCDLTTGGGNTFVGRSSGRGITTGGNNTIIGTQLLDGDAPADSDNCAALGYNAAGELTSDNQIALGNSSISSIKGQVSYGTYSDSRDKTDVVDLPDNLGLSFVNSMSPKVFHQNPRGRYYEENEEGELVFNQEDYDDGTKKNTTPTVGFLAQEVQTLINNLPGSVDYDFIDDDDTRKTLRYGDLTALLVKAVQELSAKCDDYESRLAALEAE